MWPFYLLVCLLIVVVYAVGRVAVRALWQAGAAGQAGLAVIAVLCGWAVYRAVVPSEASYLREFARLTGMPLPASSTLLVREATFPDHYGHYTACFLARVPPAQLVAMQAQLGAGRALARPATCAGAQLAGGGAVQYVLSGKADGVQAIVTVTADPGQGRLMAEWQVRRQLLTP